jgi:hypothetical protein
MDAGATAGLLARTFAELGATGSVVRTFLLRDRQFVGQGFRCGGFQAVLPAGGGMVEFYDQAGVLLKTVSLEETEKKTAA